MCCLSTSYLAIREPLEAARILARRTDQSALRAALLVCLAANQLDAAKMYGRKYVQQCLLTFDWTAAKEVVQSHECFKVGTNSTVEPQGSQFFIGGGGVKSTPHPTIVHFRRAHL